MKIIFAGTSDFAVTILDSLYKKGHNIQCVITQPDRPTGRKKILTPGPVKIYAGEKDLNIFQPENINTPESINHIISFDTDVFIVAAYGQKIGTELLNFAPYKAINVHGSLLPELRGAAPIQYSIIRGFRETGITTMLMNEGMDTGDILLQKSIPIDINDNYATLSGKLAHLGGELITKTLDKISEIAPVKQDDGKATKAKSIKKEDTFIDFSADALTVHNLIRGLYPKPNALCRFEDKTVKLLVSDFLENTSENTPGEIKEITKNGIVIYCGKGTLLLKEIQPEGSKAMKAYDFAMGRHLACGMKFTNI
ncbi:MAG: methionyl-tRNA formyltransferase [Armatimonadetes bacterium]|nr:methionyl-tRNA formyltransferase [Candidatus Hippobium faecium]